MIILELFKVACKYCSDLLEKQFIRTQLAEMEMKKTNLQAEVEKLKSHLIQLEIAGGSKFNSFYNLKVLLPLVLIIVYLFSFCGIY